MDERKQTGQAPRDPGVVFLEEPRPRWPRPSGAAVVVMLLMAIIVAQTFVNYRSNEAEKQQVIALERTIERQNAELARLGAASPSAADVTTQAVPNAPSTPAASTAADTEPPAKAAAPASGETQNAPTSGGVQTAPPPSASAPIPTQTAPPLSSTSTSEVMRAQTSPAQTSAALSSPPSKAEPHPTVAHSRPHRPARHRTRTASEDEGNHKAADDVQSVVITGANGNPIPVAHTSANAQLPSVDEQLNRVRNSIKYEVLTNHRTRLKLADVFGPQGGGFLIPNAEKYDQRKLIDTLAEKGEIHIVNADPADLEFEVNQTLLR